MNKIIKKFIFKYAIILFLIILPFSACKENHPEPVNNNIVRYGASISFHSKILNRSLQYSVYLPEKYSRDKKYATVYLLHGYGGNETDWMKDGKIDLIINNFEQKGLIDPMIYIMPQGDNSYYVNKSDGSSDYMRMFTEELVPLIDSLYSTIKDRDHRAVVGFSMGGYGALILPTKNPNLFSVSVPLSMSFRTDEQYLLESQSVFDIQWGPIFGGKGSSGNARLTDYYKQFTPFHFFNDNPSSSFDSIHYFIDCGDDEESLSITNNAMHSILRSKNIQHEYRVRNGAHNWDYWRSAMFEVLPFIQSCFAGKTYPKEANFIASEVFSGNMVQQTTSGITLNICLPKNYLTSGLSYPTLFYFHSIYNDRFLETKEIASVLDSLQKVKPFILVEMNASQIDSMHLNFKNITTFIDQTYRTKTNNYNRTGIGNKIGGKVLYDYSVNYPELINSAFLFDATLGNVIFPPVSKFLYLDCTDEGVNYDSMQSLYSQCRDRSIPYEFRVRNGMDTYNSFLQGVYSSIISIDLTLKN